MALLDAVGLRDALRAAPDEALARFVARRRRHLLTYHRWSRWLTPLFQSDHDWAAACRDRLMHPLSRLPGGRGEMLRVLTGTRVGALGTLELPDAFLEALHAAAPARDTVAAMPAEKRA